MGTEWGKLKISLVSILLIISFLSLASLGGMYLYSRKSGLILPIPTIGNLFKIGSQRQGYSSEVVSFDPTKTPAIFAIEEVDAQNENMTLTYVFPLVQRGITIVSKIKCLQEDSKVIKTLEINETGPQHGVEAPGQLLYLLADGGDTLQGICSDFNCTSIVNGCVLLKSKK